MSCNQCATQSQAMLATAGVPAEQVQATFSQERKSAVWEYLPRCPQCKKWVSPRSGICNYRYCDSQGQQVHEDTIGWPPPQAQWVSPAEARLNRRLDTDNATGRVVISNLAGVEQLHNQTLRAGYERSDIARHQASVFADQVHEQFGVTLPGSRHSLGVPYDNFTYAQVREYAQMWRNIQDGAWEQANQDANGRLTEPTEVMVWSRTRQRNEPMTLHYRNAREVDVVSASGRTHHVQNHSGHTECSCEDYQYRHAHRGTNCRHIEAVNNNLGNLPESIQGLQDGVIPADGREQVQEQIGPATTQNTETTEVEGSTPIHQLTRDMLVEELVGKTEAEKQQILYDYYEKTLEQDLFTSRDTPFFSNGEVDDPIVTRINSLLNTRDWAESNERLIEDLDGRVVLNEFVQAMSLSIPEPEMSSRVLISKISDSIYYAEQIRKTLSQLELPNDSHIRNMTIGDIVDNNELSGNHWVRQNVGMDMPFDTDDSYWHEEEAHIIRKTARLLEDYAANSDTSAHLLNARMYRFGRNVFGEHYQNGVRVDTQQSASFIRNLYENGIREDGDLIVGSSLVVLPSYPHYVPQSGSPSNYYTSITYQQPFTTNRHLFMSTNSGVYDHNHLSSWANMYGYRPGQSTMSSKRFVPNPRQMAKIAVDLAQIPQNKLSSLGMVSNLLERETELSANDDLVPNSPSMQVAVLSLPEYRLSAEDISYFQEATRSEDNHLLRNEIRNESPEDTKSIEEITQIAIQSIEMGELYRQHFHGSEALSEERVQEIIDDANQALELLPETKRMALVEGGVLSKHSFDRVGWVQIGHEIAMTSMTPSNRITYERDARRVISGVNNPQYASEDDLRDAYRQAGLSDEEIEPRIPSGGMHRRSQTGETAEIALIRERLTTDSSLTEAVQITVDTYRETDYQHRQAIHSQQVMQPPQTPPSVQALEPDTTPDWATEFQERTNVEYKTPDFSTLVEQARNGDIADEYAETVTGGLDNFTFGIELECKHGTDRNFGNRLARRLHEEGLSTYNEMLGWRGNRRSGYQTFTVEYDSSVGRSGGHGVEIVTPPLQDTPEDWAKVKRITEIIEELGGYTDNDCGSHVHVGCSRFGESPANYQQVAKLFGSVQGGMYKLATVGDSHRGTMYARPYDRGQLESVTSMSYVRENMNPYARETNRRAGLNFSRSGSETSSTIEGRLFDGTVNIHTIQRNVALMAGLVQTAQENIQTGVSVEEMEFQAMDAIQNASEQDSLKALDSILNLIPSQTMKNQIACAWFQGNN